MTFAKTLLRLWSLRLWVGIGLIVGAVAAVGSVAMSHSTVYATASTQMLVDSPDSALSNANTLLDGYVARAGVFARMMTSDEALEYIGKAAGINGQLIEATGPIEINGSPAATHDPVALLNGQALPASKTYKLTLVQNPSLPTVDVRERSDNRAGDRIGERRSDGIRDVRQSTERRERPAERTRRGPSARRSHWRGSGC